MILFGIIPLAAGVVTTLRMSAKNSVWELIDYTTYSEMKSGMSSSSTVIFYVLGNQHHRLQLLFPVFPVVKMCIRAVAAVQVVVVQVQTQVLQCVFRAVKLVIKKHGLHCNQA